MGSILVKMHHAKALNYCSKGVKHWCIQHGISYIKFIKEGINEDIILAIDDSMSREVVKMAREMENNNGR